MTSDHCHFNSSQLRRLSVIDSTWVMNTNNGLQGHAHPAWLHLYLATCKLLHLALSLPAIRLPQFQMYRWAFVGDDVFSGDGDISNSSSNCDQLKVTPNFVPYLNRIYRLLRNKVSSSIELNPTNVTDQQFFFCYDNCFTRPILPQFLFQRRISMI